MKAITFLALLLCCSISLFAEDNTLPEPIAARLSQGAPKNSEGREFWICFQKNFRDGDDANANLSLELFLTSNENADVLIEIEAIGYSQRHQVLAGTVVNVKIDPKAQITSSELVERRAIHIVADVPIAVYGLNRRFQTTDTYLGLPTSALGTEYRVIAYEKLSPELLSQFAVIATEDETEITITPTASTARGKPAGVPYTINLKKGDIYQVIAGFNSSTKSDLTGTLIRSNKKISVFSGHNCAYVPFGVPACNHLVEQLPPVSSWGKQFYVGTLQMRTQTTLRILASEPGTKIFQDAQYLQTLDAGQYYEIPRLRSNAQISADKPVLVAQYAQGFQNGDSIGDPMMILVSPTQQFLKKYRFATPVNGAWQHFINVVVPREAVATMQIDGKPINPGLFTPFGTSRYAIAQISIPYGTHTIEGQEPFGLYSYGFGFKNDAYDAYGNMGGQNFEELVEVKDTLSPMGEYSEPARQLILRDDREIDKGMKKITMLSSEGLTVNLPTVSAGAPQINITVAPLVEGVAGRAAFVAEDVAGNTSAYTLCYQNDPIAGKYVFTLSGGAEAECIGGTGMSWGIFGQYNLTFHSPSFIKTGSINAERPFSGDNGSGGWFGAFVSKRLTSDWAATAKLSFEQYGGVLSSADTSTSRARLSNGELVSFQQGSLLELNNSYLVLAVGAEYYIASSIYLQAGLKAALAIGSDVTLRRNIVSPPNFVYPETNSRDIVAFEGDPGSLSSLLPGGYAGFGIVIPITATIGAYSEAEVTRYFGNVISDGDWGLTLFGVKVGVRFRL